MDWVLLRNQWSQKYVSAVNGRPLQAKLSKGVDHNFCNLPYWPWLTKFNHLLGVDGFGI